MNTTISDKKKVRDSNMELLRILSMLGILIVHADFFALGVPSSDDIIQQPFLSIYRLGIESLTIVCVNIFVLLSGWYGIRPKIKRLLEFLFQILFFNILFYVLFSFWIPDKTLTAEAFGSIFMLDDRFWFVKAYLLLYIMSPIINSYTQQASLRNLGIILIGFYIFEILYGWLFKSVSWFKYGYSTISFIGIYLLANYLKRIMHTGGGKLKNSVLLISFLSFVIINTVIAFTAIRFGKNAYIEQIYAYNSPLVILGSVIVFLLFTKLHFENKWINYVGASSFAAFLFHGNYFFIEEIYVKKIRQWFANDTIAYFSLKTCLFILIVFFTAVVIDKVRLNLWKRIQRNAFVA